MTEYITKKQAQDILCRGCNKELHLICRCDKWAEIRRTGGIDIVRCEVCKYWSLEKELTRLSGEQYTIGYCCLEDKYSDCDWFCADGERKPALKHADEETLQSAT